MNLDPTTGLKWLEPRRLAELLLQLPEGTQVCVNQIGNLFIADENGKPYGFIDFSGAGSVERPFDGAAPEGEK